MYIKNLVKVLEKDYKTVVAELKVISPTFEVKGGLNTPVEDGLYKTYLNQNGLVVNDDGDVNKFIATDGAKLVGNDTVDRSEHLSYNGSSITEYNELEATIVDPLKIKAIIANMNVDANVALRNIKKLKASKTLLTDALIRDKMYIKTLFSQYTFVIIPINLGYRIRDIFNTMFTKLYVTTDFSNKVIAYNDSEALTAFIINA